MEQSVSASLCLPPSDALFSLACNLVCSNLASLCLQLSDALVSLACNLACSNLAFPAHHSQMPGLPGMHPHCSNLQCSLPSLSILSFKVYTCLLSSHLSLFLGLHHFLTPIVLSFAAVLFVVILNTPMLFVASGKPPVLPLLL